MHVAPPAGWLPDTYRLRPECLANKNVKRQANFAGPAIAPVVVPATGTGPRRRGRDRKSGRERRQWRNTCPAV